AMICSSGNRFLFISPSFNRGRTLISVGGNYPWQVSRTKLAFGWRGMAYENVRLVSHGALLSRPAQRAAL
ncbi:hypothetical protein, partial [Mesorhizobium sp. M0768]|uniref:hypothetical protein n=1 Tax=Mesorhizobium sp. M0768 TaxID=2956996 RepID=UPI00333D42D5